MSKLHEYIVNYRKCLNAASLEILNEHMVGGTLSVYSRLNKDEDLLETRLTFVSINLVEPIHTDYTITMSHIEATTDMNVVTNSHITTALVKILKFIKEHA